MARVNKQVARADIYARGLRTKTTENKQGYTLDKSKPADEKDTVIIKKGQTYYSWQLYRSSKQYSLTYPRPQQLTSSSFMISVYDIQDELEAMDSSNFGEVSDLKDAVDNIVEQIRDLQSTTQDSLDNMPESLQNAPTGELLQERIDALENWASELEGIDLEDFEEPEDTEDDWEDLDEEEQAQRRYEKVDEWATDKLNEIQGIYYEG